MHTHEKHNNYIHAFKCAIMQTDLDATHLHNCVAMTTNAICNGSQIRASIRVALFIWNIDTCAVAHAADSFGGSLYL